MKVKIKYIVITYSGERTSITQTYDNCPDFEVWRGEPLILDGKQYTDGFDYTIEYQVDEWVQSFDKYDWMQENDVATIIDWKVVSAKKESKNLIVTQKKVTQSEMVGIWLKMVKMSDEMKANFMSVYSEMEPSIRKLKFDKQIDITMKSLDVGIKSALNVYKRLNDYSKAMDEINLDDYRHIEHGKHVYDNERMRKDIEDKINFNNFLTE